MTHEQWTTTHKCTLKCKDCTTFTPRFQNASDCDFNKTWDSFSNFLNSLDFLNGFIFGGGEPFLYDKLGVCLQKMAKSNFFDKIGYTQITTNGTVVPSDELLKMFADFNVFIVVSNYQKLSRNLNALIGKLNEFKVSYDVDYRAKWYSSGMPRKGDPLNEDEAMELCKECARNCWLIWNNKFYKCPFLKAGEELGFIPIDSRNSLCLDSERYSYAQLQTYIKSFYPGCAYCVGWPTYGGKFDIPMFAIQMD